MITLGEKTEVTLSPGVTGGELMEFFLNNDICFESDVILPTVTYGGVLSGGCHVSILLIFLSMSTCMYYTYICAQFSAMRQNNDYLAHYHNDNIPHTAHAVVNGN